MGLLGLVAGIYDELNIGENIDRLIKQNPNCRNLSIGTLCKALIISRLGFVGRTLYMVDTFFDGKPVETVLGSSVTRSQFNDSVLGRALDDIQRSGTTERYSELVPTICRQLGLDPKFSHMDSADFHLDGRYNSDNPPEADSSVLHLTQGV
ncbi:MAG: transposase [Patiriisocius sp.]|jgi:transposase